MSCMLPVPPIELVSLDSDGLHTAHWASAQISTGENRASFNSVFMASVPSTPMQQWQLVQGMQNLKLQAQGTQGTQSQSQWQLVGPGESQWQIVGPTPQVQPKPMQPPQAMQPMPMQATPVTMPPMQAIPGMPPGPFAFGGYGGYSGYGPPCGGPCCRVQRLRVRQQQVPAASQQETLGALIVTITEGSSYDPIFQQVEQTDDQGQGSKLGQAWTSKQIERDLLVFSSWIGPWQFNLSLLVGNEISANFRTYNSRMI